MSLKEVGHNGLTTLFGGGIVNPFGPTLIVVVTDGRLEQEKTLPILHMVLNPFDQDCQVVGDALIRQTWNPFEALPKFFGLPFGSCPTLLLPGACFDPIGAEAVYGRFLQTFEDGSDVLKTVTASPGNPWQRVQQEVDKIPELILRHRSGQDDDARSRPLNELEAKALAAWLLEPDNLKAELQAFMHAWRGSIEYQGCGGGSRAFADSTLELETCLDVFAELAMTCRLPKLSDWLPTH